MRNYLKILWAWVLAVLRAWHGWLAGSALMGVIGLGQSLEWWKPGYKAYPVLACGFLFSLFEAWKKEYVENRKGPQIFMEWDSGQPWHNDRLRFRNLGTSSALNVKVGPFSRPELHWYSEIEIQSIHPGDAEKNVVADFALSKGNQHNVGHLGHILKSQYKNSEPLSVDIIFWDANRTRFTRTFILRQGTGGRLGPEVVVEMGHLRIERT